ncbi:predicted protein [Uncinocarpus reesii 1704]|uniref:DSBA-like thioredoxin domain-containing protein n=1 Tax=Uncinocarpus reesii (strain UAMH 1704) TaxID=336963 RepID=C4JKC6_UNCRE|nr:uncharacterized protein UREG_02083 [Uncinocarpus reesii 1704]EEP77234.1 predicted protein [Uncinocarpus reesii 1704]
MAVIQISIISDVICPWRAIEIFQKTYPGGSRDTFEINWKPYFIDQEAPTESELIQDRMLRRMQDPKTVAAAQTRLARAGREVGLHLKFGGAVGSSRLAHQVLQVVGAEKGSAMQCRVAESFFHCQFERELDTSGVGVVLEACAMAGLDGAEVRGWLEAGMGKEEVEREEREERRAGVQGVPRFVVGEREVDGAVDFAELFEAFVVAREGVESAHG